MNFSERLKELRAQKGVSQMKLARDTGLSQSAVAKWETGRTEPTATALMILSKYFDESVDYLLGMEE